MTAYEPKALKSLVTHLDKLVLALHKQTDAVAANIHTQKEASEQDTKQPKPIGPISVKFEAPIAVAEKEQPDAKINPAPNQRDWLKFWLEIVGLSVIVWYAYTTNGLLVESQKQTKLSEEALTSIQRAFIVFGPIESDVGEFNILTTPNPTIMRFKLNIENSGTTPTRHAFMYGSSSWISKTEDFRMSGGSGGAQLIQSTFGPRQTLKTNPITIDFNAAMKPPEGKRLIIWGWLKYYDIFPNTRIHVTEFCRELTGAAFNKKTGEMKVAFTTYRKYNCTDEDCENYGEFLAREYVRQHPIKLTVGPEMDAPKKRQP